MSYEKTARTVTDKLNLREELPGSFVFEIEKEFAAALQKAVEQERTEIAHLVEAWDGDSHYYKSEIANAIRQRTLAPKGSGE